jgi:small conductance mechanosensitive channel
MDIQNLTTQPELITQYLIDLSLRYGPGLIGAIVILVAGSWAIGWVNRLLKKALEKASIEPTLKTFLSSLLRMVLYVLLFITVLLQIGVPMTSFLTILGAAGLAIGLALQGSLSNFAGGVLILAFKPFKVDDVIQAHGEIGRVSKIDILHTHLNTGDNRRIVMPNGALANSNVVNFTKNPIRRIDLPVGIAYSANIQKAREVITETLLQDERILQEQGVQVLVSALADSSVNLTVRAWVDVANFWPVHFESLERIKLALDANNIEIPFPQRVIHTKQS